MKICRVRALTNILLIVVAVIIVDTTLKFQVEQYARKQARNTLSKVSSCIDNSTKDDIIDKVAECASGVTTTPTGDMFAYNLNTKEFVFDPSLDCKSDVALKMTDESLCPLHNNAGKCIEALKVMDLGYDSTSQTRASWLFDDATEYLEWIVYPNEHQGIYGIERGGNLTPNQVVIAIGVQSDELEGNFNMLTVLLRILAFIGICVALVFTLVGKRNV
jgi:hypothetical protein